MISVEEALALIEKHRPDFGVEKIALQDANGRTLGSDVFTSFTQPAFPTSSMDGYALRKVDIGSDLAIIGESRAGGPYDGSVREGEAVRIFTGAILPRGADFVEIQEFCEVDGDKLSFTQVSKGRDYVRPAGLDFKKGDRLFEAGTRISPGVILALATANVASVQVKKMPTIAVLRSGDELKPLGSQLKTGHIIDSNGPGLIAILSGWGVDVEDMGVVTDDLEDIKTRISNCKADIILPVGGASIGDYDLMNRAFSEIGFKAVFEKVAVKPGKPVWLSYRESQNHGQAQIVLGLPGNPYSAWSCAHLFLAPLLGRALTWKTYQLTDGLPENGIREHYLRARRDANGGVTPLNSQMSAVLSIAQTDVLIRRAPLADEIAARDKVRCLDILY